MKVERSIAKILTGIPGRRDGCFLDCVLLHQWKTKGQIKEKQKIYIKAGQVPKQEKKK
jgi:hypothetical protein